MPRKIEVIAPQDKWSKCFEQEKSLLETILTQQIVSIEHIGSTAIKNSSAKPVIDILMVVKAIQEIDSYNLAFEKIGYTCLGENGISERRFFTKGGDNRSHHLHVFQEGNTEIKRHLVFRDFMNHHPEQTEAYSQLKINLAEKFPYDIESYVAGKDAFIKEIDQKAKIWYNRTASEEKN
ncbi:hypothetical protein ATZ33_15990 [Enterococcus silesiacus]|uniref:GrpB family protein n=1 Tax=Enterococcus silesiacus TaxID=332949 RepID=A0A0S3KEX5_9ENTE|nr:GrpB family protein [Enterococcus silesiacus]ALS02821.1 hypothetical protein ATZ33_15990 [Enterococcus silesiacus]OJG85794.1 hypothetical protein RV15_GL002473 [Enterococcus silesiacus]